MVLMDSASVSGPVRQLGAVIRPLAALGYELHCVVFQRAGKAPVGSPEFLRRMGASVTIVSDARAFDASVLRKLAALITHVAPDIIETHGYRPSVLLAALRLTRRLRIPWIGYFHGRTAETRKVKLYDAFDHIALRLADLVVVMSEKQRAEKANYEKEVRILYNAAIEESSSTVSVAELSERLGGFPGPFVGVIGRLSPEKGVDVLIEAWRQLAGSGTKGTLVVAGDGPERLRYEAIVREADLADRVAFLGHLDGTRNLYGLLRVLVIPSRSEGLPNVLLEALRAGVAIVSTTVGAVPEIIRDTNVATLVAPDDARALASGIDTALRKDAPEDRQAARVGLLHSLSLESRVRAIVDTYLDVGFS